MSSETGKFFFFFLIYLVCLSNPTLFFPLIFTIFFDLFCSFQNPIQNGQHTNSTANDVKLMNLRSHILYEQLKGFVQRMDMNVVKKDLPPKTVFVLTVKLSPLQRKLYQRFLRVHGFTKDKVSGEIIKKHSFFAGYQALAQVDSFIYFLPTVSYLWYLLRLLVVQL